MNVPFADYLGLHDTVSRLMEKLGFNTRLKTWPQHISPPNVLAQGRAAIGLSPAAHS